ncbi:ribose-5-phosphate isomerase [Hydrogenispora ethanolica]|jgi:ribose 5-phosphate isomerase A|uniref:Ribose-5-phosphate isomerase A n=1 Tax=Hydrogenispora ethanolica TaxID=1082276 RepID=A0A4R1RU33_HYDET|nr:ribose-5-phosphate isomerase RpiA [Hydrogenispora ethanolica]TCL70063.1 ribose-5-phosphate isomerase [Hydrogenispora ethanolica]
MKSAESNKELKRLVGVAAAGLVRDGMVCGIGTGSTVVFFIEELGRRVKEDKLRLTGVPTSFQSKLLCRKYNIPTLEIQDCAELDLAVDGADEVDPDLNAIKGGGAAHTREKVVAAMAREFVLIIDQSKRVERLGTAFPVPVEVIPSALQFVTARLRALGGEPELRMGVRKDGPVITDNGGMVLDVRFDPRTDLRRIDQELHVLPGVVETGLFYDLAKRALVGRADGMTVETLEKRA